MADRNVQDDSIRTNWQRAWEEFTAAKAEAEEYERAVFDPAYEKIEAARANRPLFPVDERKARETAVVPDWDAINEKMEELNQRAYSDLEWRLLLTPAPDRDALEWKMNFLFGDDDEYSDCWRMDGVNAFLADVRRLLNH